MSISCIRRMLKEILFVLAMLLTTCASEILPMFIQEPESAVISHHASVTLRCKVTPSSAVVRWKYNYEYISEGDIDGVYMEDHNLYIEKFKHGKTEEGHEGVYQCVAQTPLGAIVSAPAVLSRPVLKRFPDQSDVYFNVVEGQHVLLPCKAPESLPAALLQFRLNQSIITSSDHYRILPTGLLISGVSSQDHGQYRCIAVNPMTLQNRSANHLIHLHVWNSSTVPSQEVKIVSVQTKVQTYSDESVFLECSVTGTPVPDIQWVKYGGDLPENRSVILHGNLLISRVHRGDEGTYVCKASNGNGHEKENATILEIIEPPVIAAEFKVMTATFGKPFRLRCSVSGKPAADVTWYHDGEPVTRPQTANQDVSTYVIDDVEASSAGLYQCMGSNSEGTSHDIMQLQVEGITDIVTMGVEDENDIPVHSPSSALPIVEKGGNNRTQKISDKQLSPGKRTKSRRKGSMDRDRHKKKKNRKKKTDRKRKNRRKPQKHREGAVQKLVPASKPDITQLSDTTVMLNWTVPANDGLKITLFRVQYKEVAPTKGPWQTEERDLNSETRVYEVSGLKKGGTYKFRIAAIYDNNDNKIGKNSDRFTLHVEPASHPEPPVGKPIIVEAIPIEYENVYAIRIHWQYIPVESSPIEGVLIYYKPYDSKGEYMQQRLYGPNLEKHTLQKLSPDTEYSIKMQCFNSAGESNFSNMVVKRTLGGTARRPPFHNDDQFRNTDPPDKSTETPSDDGHSSKTNTQSSSEMLYMILGIVLGIMMLLLIVFMFMCWWKQRQQRRMMDAMNDAVRGKFQDPSQRIYSDSMRKKYMNGGFALNGLNGTIVNGHIPHTYPKMNINVNPMPDTDTYSVADSRQNHYQPSTFLPNGSVVGNHHGSDNNCNNINRTKSLEHPIQSEKNIQNNGETLEEDNSNHISNCHELSPERQSNNKSCDYLAGSHDQVYTSGDFAHRQSYEGSLPELYNGMQHKHKRRRRRPQSREQNTKDQATNTDLSSNEGTLEFSTFNGLSSSQDSTGQVPQRTSPLKTFTSNDSQCSDLNSTPEEL